MSSKGLGLFESPQIFNPTAVKNEIVESLKNEIESYAFKEVVALNIDKWTAVSALHKAVRFVNLTDSYMTISRLLKLDPDYAFRRMVVMCYEDIGIANLRQCIVINALNSKFLRKSYSDEKLGYFLAHKLAESPKNRTATDIFCLTLSDPDAPSYLHGCLKTKVERLVDIAIDTTLNLTHRMTALRVISGISDRQSNGFHRTISKPRLDLLHLVCDEMNVSDDLTNAVLLGNGKTAGLNAALLLANEMLMNSTKTWIVDNVNTSQYHHGINLAALDIYCQSGRSVIAKFVASSKTLQKYFLERPVKNPAKLVGIILFNIEGSLLNRELCFDGSLELKAELEYFEMVAADITNKNEANQLVEIIRNEMRLLNSIRIYYLQAGLIV